MIEARKVSTGCVFCVRHKVGHCFSYDRGGWIARQMVPLYHFHLHGDPRDHLILDACIYVDVKINERIRYCISELFNSSSSAL